MATSPSSLKAGFTLIELLVVLSIMAIIMSLVTVNFAGQRAMRNQQISENQLVSNIRVVQNYALSSRNIYGTQPVEYYVMKFDLSKPYQYTIEAMYNTLSTPTLVDIQTVQLSGNSRLQSPILINLEGGTQQSVTGCALLVFKEPFARILTNNSCTANGFGSGDSYNQVLNFVTNNSGTTVNADSSMVISLIDSGGGVTPKAVTINGATGLVSFQ